MGPKKLFLMLSFLLIAGLGTAQTSDSQCQVLEAQGAEVLTQDGYTNIEQDMVISDRANVTTSENGAIVLVCEQGFREVSENSSGLLNQVSEQTDEFDTDIQQPENMSIAEALNQTEQIEENLQSVNQVIDEQIPDQIASVILGDDVNFQVDDVTIGIATNESGVTGVEDGGFEDPDLSISMNESTIERIMTSENTTEEFRSAYHGEGIDVEAYTFRNKVTVGVVSTASRVYGFVSNFL